MKISFTINITRKMVLAIVVVALIGTAAAAMTLFTHTFPVIKTQPLVLALTTSCTTLVNETIAPVQGSSGNITFDCGSNVPALVTPQFVSGNYFVATPTFSLGTGYTNLFIWAVDYAYGSGSTPNTAPPCTGGLAEMLQSGVSVSFRSEFEFLYCAGYTSAPTTSFGTFTVTWTQ